MYELFTYVVWTDLALRLAQGVTPTTVTSPKPNNGENNLFVCHSPLQGVQADGRAAPANILRTEYVRIVRIRST
jgi:hypothetical protein